ncbi:MAG: amino acid decarboxylase [Neobacillus sp.]|jgi:hypothetical protein
MEIAQLDEKRTVIDVRERILRGEHPRGEIINFIKAAPIGMIFEIHLPHRAEPLVANLQSLGMNAIVNEIGLGHFRLMAIKLSDV